MPTPQYYGIFYGEGAPVYDVKAYGAVGNGSTDDTGAIISAIDSASNGNGGVVFFPPGIYVVSSVLRLYSGVTLQGTTWGIANQGSVIAPNFSGDLFTTTAPSPPSNGIAIRSLTIAPSVTQSSGAVFNFSATSNAIVDSVNVTNCYDFMQLGKAGLNECNQVYVSNCTVGGQSGMIARYAFHFTGIGGNFHIDHCEFTGAGAAAYGMYFDNGAFVDPLYATNLDFEGFGYGIYLNGTTASLENAYFSNIIFDTLSAGSAVNFSPPTSSASGGFQYGIVEQVQFSNCWFTQSTTALSLVQLVGNQAASATGGVYGIQFSNCQLLGNGTTAGTATVNIQGGASDIGVTGCIIGTGTGSAGVTVKNTTAFPIANIALTGNTVDAILGSGPPALGFDVYSSSGGGGISNVSITGGVVNGATTTAVNIQNASGTLSGVNVTGVTGSGNATGLTTSGTLTKCYVSGNAAINPIGSLTAPTFTSGTPTTNTFAYNVRVNVTGTTAVAINGTATGLATGSFVLAPGETITPTGAGSWTWSGL